MENINNATNKLEYMDFLYKKIKKKKNRPDPLSPRRWTKSHYASRPQASRRN